jgi:hypothetical protein
MTDQLDIYGDVVELGDVADKPIAATQAEAEQPRLFEPQYEGQLALGEGDGDDAS